MGVQIQQLKENLKKNGLRGLALDIDDTLSETNAHWYDHMVKFSGPKDLTKEKLLKSGKWIENIPEWQTEKAQEHMKATLHSNDFNEAIPLIHGADEAVRAIDRLIPIVAYITARPATVIEGTLNWLKKHGFPEAELITRPEDIKLEEFNVNKNKWKAQILAELYPEVIGIVDDNMGLTRELEALDYKGTVYLYRKETNEFEGHKQVVVCP
ncbi:MAG: hypothetical protein UX31_C0001G0024 [Candidatus Nomurabacteria bacterium GW2011_GWA1_46_11]|uniref:Uncharacterized protein n=2 Tax=Parcubacteria group TaxID=1794811 RepID=A0A1F8F1E1_9BACT|nr:MAG: hypothetical protein UX31_C0001G0024 [Candidatus Nomurabacteria bacterium GW2011_GWA1_46_11]OGN06056.1 MAG: hypothetical protein A2669_00805 [Candidatus Yanofskybacteria bacterium RIFCSPHIGHO2_01_FULL_48_25b]